jgi:hypothetical protein
MKLLSTIGLLFVIFVACFKPDKKIYIKSIMLKNQRVDWYFYSLISNFSRSYVELSNNELSENVFFESFFVSDINLNHDTLYIEVYENNYKLDSAAILKTNIKIVVDTTGKVWNQASSRLGRLQRKDVDFSKPHFSDSYCPKGECY